MHILLSKNKTEDSYKNLECNSFCIHYKLNAKELFFENSKFYLFLKTNYSENYTDSVFAFPEKVTQESIEKSFQKDGFWITINKEDNSVLLFRDVSGLCSGYYCIGEDQFCIATNVHDLAKVNAEKLNNKAVHQLLYFDFLWDGQTIYENIFQLKLGGKLVLNNTLKEEEYSFSQPNITENENQLSDEENIKLLRKKIVEAHKRYLNDQNVVFLSGGIDSVAMLIALNDLTSKEKIVNHSFKVKGTIQDETVYAKSIADHLDNELLIVERDFSNEINEALFKQEIVKMNNPYPGMWVFGNQISKSINTTYFAGQDTRLHTPSLNKLDTIAFSIFMLSKKGLKPLFMFLDVLLYPFKKLFDLILKVKNIKSKYFLGLRRALYLFNTKAYIKLVYFKVDEAILNSYKLPIKHFKDITEAYNNISLKGLKNKRALYNTIVSKKWVEQYVNDMRYMVDMVNNQGGRLAMPFYDMDLAKFSATIPFDLSIKTMKGKAQFNENSSTINKYVLREAFLDKIDKKTYLRSKAVSRTGHIIFNQGLGNILKEIIIEDLSSSNSFINDFKLERFLERFLKNKNNWIMTDDKYLLKIYYVACLIVYNNRLKKV
jgi:asparagine synthetase B (glutamine-hydrolysing)